MLSGCMSWSDGDVPEVQTPSGSAHSVSARASWSSVFVRSLVVPRVYLECSDAGRGTRRQVALGFARNVHWSALTAT